jgi:hypothetical protein
MMAIKASSISMEQERQLSYGEKAVGLTFNPSNNAHVQQIKEQFAAVIDTLSQLRGDGQIGERTPESAEVARMLSVAITEAQTAQMWAVKGCDLDELGQPTARVPLQHHKAAV